MPWVVGQFSIERGFDGQLCQNTGKLIKIGFGFKAL